MDASSAVRPSTARSAMDASTVVMDGSDYATCPTEGAIVIVGRACPDGPVATPAPLLLDLGAALADDYWVAWMATTFRGATARRVSSRPTLQHMRSIRPTSNFHKK
jgi:hypothetical protein